MRIFKPLHRPNYFAFSRTPVRGVSNQSKTQPFNLARKTAEACAQLLHERGCLVENTRDYTLLPFRIESTSYGEVLIAQINPAVLTETGQKTCAGHKISGKFQASLHKTLIPNFTAKISGDALLRVKSQFPGRVDNTKLFFFQNELVIFKRDRNHQTVFSGFYVAFVFSPRPATEAEIRLQQTALEFAREQDVPLGLFIQIDLALEKAFADLIDPTFGHNLAFAKPKLSDTQMHTFFIPFENLDTHLDEAWGKVVDRHRRAGNGDVSEMLENSDFAKDVNAELRKKVNTVFIDVGESLLQNGIAPYYPRFTLTSSAVVLENKVLGFVVGMAYGRDEIGRRQKQMLFEKVNHEVQAREKMRHLD